MRPDEIKDLRKELGCTAKELAKALELEQSTVMGWEKGELFPTKQYVDRMEALRQEGPSRFPKKSRGKKNLTPMELLADETFWTVVRKVLAHDALRTEVMRLAEAYDDPAAAPSPPKAEP